MKSDHSYPTLCIPKIDGQITDKNFISDIFTKLNWGEIEYINVVPNKVYDNITTHKVFIHFKRWYTSCQARKYRDRIINKQPVNIVYNAPWYWKIKISYY